MYNITLIKSLFKEFHFQNLITVIESNPINNSINGDEFDTTIENSEIFYYYIRANLELGEVDKSLQLAEHRYVTKNLTTSLESRLFTIIAYA